MTPKSLEITHYQFEELRIGRNQEYEDSPEQALVVTVDFQLFINREDTTKFAVGLTIITGDDSTPDKLCPLNISLRIGGFFEVPTPLPDGRVPFELVVNGLTILYGIARGEVRTISSSFNARVLLPTVYFSPLVQARLDEAPPDLPLLGTQAGPDRRDFLAEKVEPYEPSNK